VENHFGPTLEKILQTPMVASIQHSLQQTLKPVNHCAYCHQMKHKNISTMHAIQTLPLLLIGYTSGSQPFLMHSPFAHFGTFYSSPITRVCRNIWSTDIFFLTWLLPVTVWLIVRVRGLVLTAIGTMHFIEHNNLINKSGTKLFVKQWH